MGVGEQRLQLFYTGHLNYYAVIPSRTFQIHEGGIAYSSLLGENQQSLVNTGASLTLRNNRDEFESFDHTQLSLYGNIQTELSDMALLRGGYGFRVVSFSSMAEFSHTEHNLFLQGALTLPTRTTLMLQGSVGFKRYTTAEVSPVTDSESSPGNGRRASGESTGGVTQILGTVRIGQGITATTGLSVTAEYQVSPYKDIRYLTLQDGLLTDDEFFDDHYGYEGPSAAVMLTQILPADFRFRASASYQQRNYSSRPAFDLAGNQVGSQRMDQRSILSFSLEKAIPDVGLKLSLGYDRIMNVSNDLFYSYRNNALSVRLLAGF